MANKDWKEAIQDFERRTRIKIGEPVAKDSSMPDFLDSTSWTGRDSRLQKILELPDFQTQVRELRERSATATSKKATISKVRKGRKKVRHDVGILQRLAEEILSLDEKWGGLNDKEIDVLRSVSEMTVGLKGTRPIDLEVQARSKVTAFLGIIEHDDGTQLTPKEITLLLQLLHPPYLNKDLKKLTDTVGKKLKNYWFRVVRADDGSISTKTGFQVRVKKQS